MANRVLYRKKDGNVMFRPPSDIMKDRVLFEGPPDFYWGKSASFVLTGAQIKSQLKPEYGNVGGYPNPKSYIFAAGSTYPFFAVRCVPSGLTYGYRFINLLRSSQGDTNPYVIASAHDDLYYEIKQLSPPTTIVSNCTAAQSIYYKPDVSIDGINYRLYRTNGHWGSSIYMMNVYSIPE
jgi:hypothetical protein